jgi:sterol desaturase/sphingolipid hydroxylase (fatty acid hydroxylase superfamily)
MLAAGYSAAIILGVCSLLTGAALMALERWIPYYAPWNDYTKQEFGRDFLHLIVVSGLGPKAFEWLIIGSLAWAATTVQPFAVVSGVLGKLPILVQVGVFMLLSEFFTYWSHRIQHRNKWLWTIHAPHHAPEKLYFLNVSNGHLDTGLTFGLGLIPLILLGAKPEVFAYHTLLNSVVGMYQHTNANLKIGVLQYVFSIGEAHRYHHDTDFAKANTNFGTNLLIWDLLFGTFYCPAGNQKIAVETGLCGNTPYPTTFLGQMKQPFIDLHQLFSNQFSK